MAVPTSARSTCEEFQTIADACICTITPDPFRAVGLWYDDFEQVTDEKVCELLEQSSQAREVMDAESPPTFPEEALERPSRDAEG